MAAAVWPKTCGNCGRPIRKRSWNNLSLKGIMKGSPRDPEAQDLELRNCACGSTLAMPVLSTKSEPPPA